MEEKFQTAFPGEKEEVKAPEGFQTAFPEDNQSVDPQKPVCAFGCGQQAKYGNLRVIANGQDGDLPRCSKFKSDCPVIRGSALRAARRAGRLGKRVQNW
jgi:hypothetical protein